MNTKQSAKVLLVEDEKNLALAISYSLERRGHTIKVANRGDTALELAQDTEWDLIILDVMLPGIDGFQICEALRKSDVHTPILMLTALHEAKDRIKGIKTGADDYLGKPFNTDELLARCEGLLRRARWSQTPALHNAASEHVTLQLGSIEFQVRELLLKGQAKQIALTAIEAKLLQLLATQPGRAISRAELLKKVWGLHEETQTRTLDTFIMRLRHHLSDAGGDASWIESVRSVGYRFATPGQNASSKQL